MSWYNDANHCAIRLALRQCKSTNTPLLMKFGVLFSKNICGQKDDLQVVHFVLEEIICENYKMPSFCYIYGKQVIELIRVHIRNVLRAYPIDTFLDTQFNESFLTAYFDELQKVHNSTKEAFGGVSIIEVQQ